MRKRPERVQRCFQRSTELTGEHVRGCRRDNEGEHSASAAVPHSRSWQQWQAPPGMSRAATRAQVAALLEHRSACEARC
jgi:hypothetical protein